MDHRLARGAGRGGVEVDGQGEGLSGQNGGDAHVNSDGRDSPVGGAVAQDGRVVRGPNLVGLGDGEGEKDVVGDHAGGYEATPAKDLLELAEL